MRKYSPYSEMYVEDICKALNEIAKMKVDGKNQPFAAENFETLRDFLQDWVVMPLDLFTYLNEKGLVNRGKCPYTGQSIDTTFPSWSWMNNRRVYLSYEGQKIMKREDDEAYEKRHGHPRLEEKKKGCYIATLCYGNEFAPEVILLKNYRDNVLSKTLMGRMFISIYYSISPWVAQKLRKADTLNNIIRKKVLDNIIKIIK